MSGKRLNKRVLYWDTCIFINWVKGEENQPDEVQKGIEQLIDKAYDDSITIMTSVLVLTEMMECDLTPEQAAKLENTFKLKSFPMVNIDDRVCRLAAEIRGQFPKSDYPTKSKMGMADSIHLATAIHFGVSAMHTLDGTGKKPKGVPLLPLNKTQKVRYLSIETPWFEEPPKPIDPESPQMLLGMNGEEDENQA